MTSVQPLGKKVISGRHGESAEEFVEEVGVEWVAGAGCDPEQHREASVEGVTLMQSVGDDGKDSISRGIKSGWIVARYSYY